MFWAIAGGIVVGGIILASILRNLEVYKNLAKMLLLILIPLAVIVGLIFFVMIVLELVVPLRSVDLLYHQRKAWPPM